ncbi:MAG: DUF488 domain-containing protein [Acidobacteria bacterium]|nr:DUF488 domain-containing protein [Acidobacteriota bacterium]MBS1864571.1 DUF488 domain-containing protein [Acidobacteriota bacterium]
MIIFTIGFTRKSAEEFFTRLARPGLKRVLDVRLNNRSQLAGFAKKSDLEYFLGTICNIEYVHLPELAPTQELLDSYKKKKGDWERYAEDFLELIRSRAVESSVPQSLLDGGCLLCSEDTPERCHRRLVAEYFQRIHGGEIVHL